LKKYYLAIPIAVAIIALAYFLYPQEVRSNQSILQTSTENKPSQPTLQALAENGSPLLGSPNAKITIIEWGDYQCTYCHAFHQNTKDQLIQQYVDSGKANFIFRDFPLNGPDSVLAAEASYCANDQAKYWQYHDELYNNWGGERTGWVNQKSLDQFATNVGLDIVEFDKCVNTRKYEQKVLDNQRAGQDIGIDGTPSFIIFSDKKVTKIVGAQPFSVFKQVLDSI
jgi:protein-disulfide isomerase